MAQRDEEYEVSPGATSVEEGSYLATCVKIENAEGLYGIQWRVTFRIDEEGDYEGVEIGCWANKPKQGSGITPKMKIFKLADALLGVDPLGLGKLRLAALIGKRCRIRIEESQRDDGSTFSRLSGFARVKTPQAKATARSGIQPRRGEAANSEEDPFEITYS